MKSTKIFLFALMSIFFIACSNDDKDLLPDNNDVVNQDPTDVLKFGKNAQKYVDYESEFALTLLRNQVASSNETEAFSPLGIYQVLAMIANANDAVVAPEILQVLTQGSQCDIKDLNDYNRIMIKVLPNLDKSITFYNNYAFAYPNGLEFDEKFMNNMQANFMPEMINFDLQSNNARALINNWAARTTNNSIENFIEENLDIDLALLNSNYTKGKWQTPFAEFAEKGEFFNSDYTQSLVDILTNSEDVICFHNDGVKGVNLPLGNGSFSFVAMMPDNRNSDLKDITSKLDANTLNGWLADAEARDIELSLPKFEIEGNTFDCIQLLQNAGIKKLFYSPISGILKNSPAMLNLFFQKTNIGVSRDGMEAASVTVATLTSSNGIFRDENDIFNFNRPFIFLVRENSTGAIIFAGQVKKLPNSTN